MLAILESSSGDVFRELQLISPRRYHPLQIRTFQRGVLPLSVVDNSTFSPIHLTVFLNSPYPFFSGNFLFSPFQAARFMMTFQIFLFLRRVGGQRGAVSCF
jgi:hypothetical protein